MEYLSREIVLDILSRLPITTLLQCKLVCRAWKDLAKDPLLVAMHFSRTGENDPCLILHSGHPIRNQLYSLELSAHNEDSRRVNKIRVPVLPQFDVVGSCKGLLCLCDSSTKNSLYICNPFSRDYIELPKSIEFPHKDVMFGFGFHPTTKEYKVVKIVFFRIRSVYNVYGLFPPEPEVQIFTLGRPAWRSLGTISYNLFQRSSGALVSGRFHWHTWPQIHGPDRLLISFDLADEQFRVVPKPDCGGLDKCGFSLVVLGGFLSAAVRRSCGQFEIWVMKDYDVKESWTKEFNIGIHVPRRLEQDLPKSYRNSKFYCNSSFVRILCLLKNGDILLDYKGRGLVSYDPISGTFKDLLFQGMPNWFKAVVHEGNLTLIDA